MAKASLILSDSDVEQGGKEASLEDDFAYNNNVHSASMQIRLAFIRKVYGLLSIQLLITTAIVTTFMACEPIKLYVAENVWTTFVSMILMFVTLIALHVKRRDHPANLILLCCFTLTNSYFLGVIVSMHEAKVVVSAFVITLSVVSGLTLFTFQAKRDFSFLGFGLFAGLIGLIVAGILQIFIHSSALELCISIFGALLFSLFIIYDTQMLMHHLSAEEYIVATINIYLDIINLFLYILRILSSRD